MKNKFERTNNQILRLRDKELMCDVRKAEIQAKIQAKEDFLESQRDKLQRQLNKIDGVKEPTLIESVTDKGSTAANMAKATIKK